MGTILYTAKQFYSDFFKNGAWNETGARELLNSKSYLDTRIFVIKFVYEIILDNPKIDEEIKKWIKTNKSLKEIAELDGVSKVRIRNQQSYTARTLDERLSIDGDNLLHFVICKENISDEEWEEIDAKIKQVRMYQMTYKGEREPLIQNRDILLNLSNKRFSDELPDMNRWNLFIQTISPYLIKNRQKVQQKVNTEFANEVAYFNYLITPGNELTLEDNRRLNTLAIALGDDDKTIQSVKNAKKEKSLIDIKEKDEIKQQEKEKNKQIEDSRTLIEKISSLSDEEFEQWKKEAIQKQRDGVLTDEELKAFREESNRRGNTDIKTQKIQRSF